MFTPSAHCTRFPILPVVCVARCNLFGPKWFRFFLFFSFRWTKSILINSRISTPEWENKWFVSSWQTWQTENHWILRESYGFLLMRFAENRHTFGFRAHFNSFLMINAEKECSHVCISFASTQHHRSTRTHCWTIFRFESNKLSRKLRCIYFQLKVIHTKNCSVFVCNSTEKSNNVPNHTKYSDFYFLLRINKRPKNNIVFLFSRSSSVNGPAVFGIVKSPINERFSFFSECTSNGLCCVAFHN